MDVTVDEGLKRKREVEKPVSSEGVCAVMTVGSGAKCADVEGRMLAGMDCKMVDYLYFGHADTRELASLSEIMGYDDDEDEGFEASEERYENDPPDELPSQLALQPDCAPLSLKDGDGEEIQLGLMDGLNGFSYCSEAGYMLTDSCGGWSGPQFSHFVGGAVHIHTRLDQGSECKQESAVSSDVAVTVPCILCGVLMPEGSGNSSVPLAEFSAGKCCDECNLSKVIPFRMEWTCCEGSTGRKITACGLCGGGHCDSCKSKMAYCENCAKFYCNYDPACCYLEHCEASNGECVPDDEWPAPRVEKKKKVELSQSTREKLEQVLDEAGYWQGENKCLWDRLQKLEPIFDQLSQGAAFTSPALK